MAIPKFVEKDGRELEMVICDATLIYAPGRTGSRVVSARFGAAQVALIRRVASARCESLATYVHRVVAAASMIDAMPDPASARADICRALALDPQSTNEQILAAVEALLAASIGDPEPDDSASSTPDSATAETADAPPLSAHERSVANSIADHAQRTAFEARRHAKRLMPCSTVTPKRKAR